MEATDEPSRSTTGPGAGCIGVSAWKLTSHAAHLMSHVSYLTSHVSGLTSSLRRLGWIVGNAVGRGRNSLSDEAGEGDDGQQVRQHGNQCGILLDWPRVV